MANSGEPRATNRGYGRCTACKYEYQNRRKPENCEKCGLFLGGKFTLQETTKPPLSAECVTVYSNEKERLLSVKVTPNDNRIFVFLGGNQAICYSKNCLELRGTYTTIGKLSEFNCKHVQLAVKAVAPIYRIIFTEDEIMAFSTSNSTKEVMKDIQLQSADLPSVVKVSEKNYAVLGVATTTSPMQYTHVMLAEKYADGKRGVKCNAENCRKKAGRTKQLSRQLLCMHKHFVILAQSLKECDLSDSNKDVEQQLIHEPAFKKEEQDKKEISRNSTLKLQSQRRIPYQLSKEMLLKSYDFVAGNLPKVFEPEDSICGLCFSNLSLSLLPQGCSSNNAFLLSNKNPFTKITIKLKKCLNQNCMALNTIFPLNKGFFNVSNKVLISLDLLIQWRELFKEGLPVTNIISRTLNSLKMKVDKVALPSDNEMRYLTDTLYNGYYAFEAMTERNLDDVICGSCGIIGKVYYGDGNEKNCCNISNISFEPSLTKEVASNMNENEASMEGCIEQIKKKLIEKATYNGVKNDFTINLDNIPPIIPGKMRQKELNTESCKKSVYLEQAKSIDSEGDAIILSELIKTNQCDIHFGALSSEKVMSIAKTCGISTTNKSKDMLVLQLQCLYETLLIGKSACHQFTKVPGHTGGFYHIVCQHGTTVCSKFMVLTESVRDTADLWLSLKFPPVLFICDTPCTFVRHVNIRSPDAASKYWNNRNGCFEVPQLGQKPKQSIDVPDIVPLEYSNAIEVLHTPEEFVHPLTGSTSRYVCGDRFHSHVNPHKSELCCYHNIDLASQSNAIKTSYQESQNNKKNKKRNRSSCTQGLMTHIFFNYLMNFYENEEVVNRQKKLIEKQFGKEPRRDQYMRFVVD